MQNKVRCRTQIAPYWQYHRYQQGPQVFKVTSYIYFVNFQGSLCICCLLPAAISTSTTSQLPYKAANINVVLPPEFLACISDPWKMSAFTE